MLLNAQVLLKNQEQMKKTSLVFSPKISSTFLTNYNEVSKSVSDASDDDVTKRDTEQESSGDEDDRTRDTETELGDADGLTLGQHLSDGIALPESVDIDLPVSTNSALPAVEGIERDVEDDSFTENDALEEASTQLGDVALGFLWRNVHFVRQGSTPH